MRMQFVEQVRETVSAWVTDYPYLTSGAVAIPTAYLLLKYAKGGNKPGLVDAPPNTVVLYQVPRGPYNPSMSPFAVKLETYLRLAKIPYQNVFGLNMSSKGKFPWISYNGEAVADSQLSIEFLNAKFGVDLNKDLTAEEKATAHAFRIMLDEHLYWTFLYFRWFYPKVAKVVELVMPKWMIFMLRRKLKKQLHGQGMGRHSTDEITQIMLQDLEALSTQLGDKPYLMGDNPTEVDCSVFGSLNGIIFTTDTDESHVCKGLLKERFPNLYNYVMRVKDTVWPDWDDCISTGPWALKQQT